MKSKLILLSLLLLAPLFGAADKDTPKAPAPGKSDEAAKRHPLKGVITAVDTGRSSLMVKHEAIPGVMRAMTMLFRVDEATLKSAKVGQTITAKMSREGDEWWLHDVKEVTTIPAR